MAHVFISYAKKDTRQFASQLADKLNTIEGLSAWWDTSLESGDSWAAQIETEIYKCDYFIVLVSPDVNRHLKGESRSFVLKEITLALQTKKIIIPVLAADTTLPFEIVDYQYLDARNDETVAMDNLIEDICRRAGISAPTKWKPIEIKSVNDTRLVLLPIKDKDLSISWAMGKHPVTNEQYRRFVEATGHPEPQGEHYYPNEGWKGIFKPWEDERFNHPQQPVVCVNYDDAIAYCSWLNKLEKINNPNNPAFFDLPKFSIWLAALGEDNNYRTKTNWSEYMKEIIHQTIQPQKTDELSRLNQLGISDLIGNVWEWGKLEDITYLTGIGGIAIVGAAIGNIISNTSTKNINEKRYKGDVYGGSFLDNIAQLEISLDVNYLPNKEKTSHSDLGFRVVAQLKN